MTMNTTPIEIEVTLQQALCSFRILGAASQDEIVQRLDERVKEKETALEAIRNEYYLRGGLAGRILLRAWGQHNADLGETFAKWLNDDPVPQHDTNINLPQTDIPPLPLSPKHKKFLENFFNGKQFASYYTPFGPEKAEDDPRLYGFKAPDQNLSIPSLFYDKLPWYPEIAAEQHSFFFAPRGCGRTAAIGQARHLHRITGYKPALSLYLFLCPPFESTHLLKFVADALGRALLDALLEDAYWFIAADHEIRADIGRFLLWWAGDLVTLLRRLRNGGLPIVALPIERANKCDPSYDSRLLTDVLGSYSSLEHICWDDTIAIVRAARVAIGKVYLTQDDWDYPIYLWVDSHLSEGVASQEIPRLWDNELLRRMGNLKIFIRHEFSDLEQIRMEWKAQHLHEMLEHRWKRSGTDSFLDKEKLGDASYMLLQEFRKDIHDKAHSPQEVIREGNRLFEQLGEPLMGDR